MKKPLLILSCLAVLALPLALTAPVSAQEAAPQPNKPELGERNQAGRSYDICECPMMMEHRMRGPGMEGKGKMGPGMEGRGMMGPGTEGRGMMGQGRMGKGMMMQEMMKPHENDTPAMAQLRQEIQAQHEKLMADRTQMRADCQRMHELFLRMKQLRGKRHKGPKTPTAKGNAAPVNPANDGKAAPNTQ